MKTIKLKYSCNAGYTEEVIYLELPDNLNEDEEDYWIQQDFLHWLDNNEDINWERI